MGGLLTRVPRQATSSAFASAHFQQLRDVNGRFGGATGFAWVGIQGVSENLQKLESDVMENLHEAAQSLADEMLEYAQANAPWEDHPGVHQDARENLQAGVVWDDETHFTIFLGHGNQVYYGVWLEVRWGGRYAIIVPTITQFAPQLSGKIRTL